MNARARLISQVAGFFGAIAIMNVLNAVYVFDFENAGFGRMTTSVLGTNEFGKLHCSDPVNSVDCEKAYSNAGRPPAVLWFGNSQLSGVNRFEVGQKTAPQLLHDKMRSEGQYVVTYGFGGATIYEFAIVYQAVRKRYDIKTVILPIVFNNFRDSPVRSSIKGFMEDAETRQAISESPLAQSLIPFLPVEKATSGTKPEDESFAIHFENLLNDHVSSYWKLWGSPRESLRTLANYVYHMGRLRLLGFNAQSKRPIINEAYAPRLRVLSELIAAIRADGRRVIVYIPPYRSDVSGPYIEKEYTTFKADVERISLSGGAEFYNIESLVPGEHWGMVEDYVFGFLDYDFMHFAYEGHVLLTDAVESMLKKD